MTHVAGQPPVTPVPVSTPARLVAAFVAGAAVGVLSGMIGLGGAAVG